MNSLDNPFRVFLVGLVAGLAIYCATVFPFALLTGVAGDPWGAIFMFYGIVVGLFSVVAAFRWF